MKTTINNDFPIYIIKTSLNHCHAGNIGNLNDLVNHYNWRKGYFSINIFENGKLKKISAKRLKEIFEANGMQQTFFY